MWISICLQLISHIFPSNFLIISIYPLGISIYLITETKNLVTLNRISFVALCQTISNFWCNWLWNISWIWFLLSIQIISYWDLSHPLLSSFTVVIVFSRSIYQVTPFKLKIDYVITLIKTFNGFSSNLT